MEPASHQPGEAVPLAEVTRNDRVESRHRGVIVVADNAGTVIAAAGDPNLFAYMRSAAKPIQAIPLVAEGAAAAYGLTDEELAVIAASHTGTTIHQELVASALAKAGLDPSVLQCSLHTPWDRATARALQERGEKPGRLHSNCSGKHSGMLLLAHYWHLPLDTYRDPEHPVQQRILQTAGRCFGLAPEAIHVGLDGCGAPTLGVSLLAMARSFATLIDRQPLLENERAPAKRIVRTMVEHPVLVGGAGRTDTDLMEVTEGSVLSKSGAEGVHCLALRDRGWGVAIKVEDGSSRAVPALIQETLRQLDALTPTQLAEFGRRQLRPVTNLAGVPVGEIRAVFTLS